MHKGKAIIVSALTHILLLGLLCLPAQSGDTEEFDSEKIISELEKQMELSKEKWEQLKPVIEEKSKDLSQGLKDSVDKGMAELDKLTKQFDKMSKDAETKMKELLSSEEAQKLRDYLAKIDKDTIEKAQKKMVQDLNELLELSEEQAKKIEPVLEESFNEIGDMIKGLADEGARNWDEFRKDFEKLTKDLHDKLKETLDQEQMEKLDEYNEEQKEKIQRALFTA